MALSDQEIRQAIDSGRIRIDPAPDLEKQLGSVSIDFRLGNRFEVFEHSRFSHIDSRDMESLKGAWRELDVKDDEPFIIQPGDFVTAYTMESLELPDDLVGRIEGRSSIARLGITVHSTAALFEPGWVGQATMTLSNLGRMPVALYPGMRICAFSFETVSSPVMSPYRLKTGDRQADQMELCGGQPSQETQAVRMNSNGRRKS